MHRSMHFTKGLVSFCRCTVCFKRPTMSVILLVALQAELARVNKSASVFFGH